MTPGMGMGQEDAARVDHSQVLVDLATLSVLPQQSSKDSHSSEPLHLGGHSGLGGTLPLTGTGVSAESLGGVQLPGSGSRVDGGGLDDAACVN